MRFLIKAEFSLGKKMETSFVGSDQRPLELDVGKLDSAYRNKFLKSRALDLLLVTEARKTMAKAKSEQHRIESATLQQPKCISLKGLNKKHCSPLNMISFCLTNIRINSASFGTTSSLRLWAKQFWRGVQKDKKTQSLLLSRRSLAACIALKKLEKTYCEWTGFDFPNFVASYSSHRFSQLLPKGSVCVVVNPATVAS